MIACCSGWRSPSSRNSSVSRIIRVRMNNQFSKCHPIGRGIIFIIPARLHVPLFHHTSIRLKRRTHRRLCTRWAKPSPEHGEAWYSTRLTVNRRVSFIATACFRAVLHAWSKFGSSSPTGMSLSLIISLLQF